ncbi:hypothetical protein AB1Y20_002956 [Prymnesium parvum]|uniref:MIF4G domain-containing protein n=1 Tax=Prymnesium parvum TaxID=97485 RepID=A0AB34JC82_PRYPA
MADQIARRLAQRQANLASRGLADEELRLRDSSLKKIGPFLKKVKERLGEEAPKLSAELPKLNLSKYVDEIAAGVVEAKLKLAELPAVVELCSMMHQSYASFTPALQPQLLALASAPAPAAARGSAAPPESDADRTARLVRKRALLRLAFDLLTAGVLTQPAPVLKLLHAVCAEDAATADPIHPHLSIVSAVAKHICYDPLLLRRPAAEEAAAGGEPPPEPVLGAAEQSALLELLREYTAAATKTLHSTHAQLLRLERSNQKALLHKGELSEESLAAYERVHKLHDKLVSGVGALCEALGEEAPVLADAKEEEKERVLVSMHGPAGGSDGLELFEDEDLRTLYEQLPDLRSVLPAVLFADPKEGKDESGSGEEVEALLARAAHASTREQIDALASDLVCAGGRFHVRKIVKALLQPPRTTHVAERTPLYGRLAAILSPCFRHLASELCAALLDDFEQLRASHSLAPRLSAIQYVSELIKFRVMPASSAFKCLKQLLDDFSPANVQVACALLEGCGRFLHRHPDTRERCEAMLELLVKLRSVHRLPGELFTMIDNAVYACKPPERSAMVEETRPLLHRYVIWLLHSHLSRTTVDRVVKQLRKLDWSNADVCEWVHNALLDCASVKYHIIHIVASVISGLARYHEAEMLRLVDAVLERVRLSVDANDFREAQKRTCLVKLLGELYNYQLLDSPAIFRTLNQLLPRDSSTWGRVVPLPHVSAHAETDGAMPSARPLLHEREPMADGPTDTSRLRLVCVLLDTCGQYFCNGARKRKLDVFLVHLLRYLFCKALTVDVEFTLTDTLNALRPKLIRPTSYSEATIAVQRLQAMLAEDTRKGEALAHELLHSSASLETGGEDDGAEEIGDDEDGDGRGELGEEEVEDDADEDMEAELEEVERQLRELEVDEEEVNAVKEEEEAYIGVQTRRDATDEEKEAFEREMQAMLAETRDVSARKTRVDAEGIKIPVALLRPATHPSSQSNAQAKEDSGPGAVTLRVLRKGAKNKMEASEVRVPASDALAKTVIRMEDKAAEERQRLKERSERVLAAAADHESGSSRGPHISRIQQSPVLPEATQHNQRKR